MRHQFQTTALLIMLLGGYCVFELVNFLAAPGDLDTTFAETGKTRTAFGLGNDEGKAVVVQPDGRVVVAGSSQNGAPILLIIRYNTDGSLDTSFGGDGIVTTTIGVAAICNALAIQSDGKLVAAGSSRNGTTEDFAVARYNTDGSLDDGGPSDTTPGDSFGSGGKVITAIGTGDDVGNAMAIQADGKLVVAGYARIGSNDDFALVRYNADGSLDNTFDDDGIVTTPIGIATDQGNAVGIQPGGKLVVAGYAHINVGHDFAVARYNTDGSLDDTFGGDGIVTTVITDGDNEVNGLAFQFSSIQPLKIVVAGSVKMGTDSNLAVARYNEDGSLDTSLNGVGAVLLATSGRESASAVRVQRNVTGQVVRILIAGYRSNGSNLDFAVARLFLDGSLDTSFGGDGIAETDFGMSDEIGNAMALQSDKIIVVGAGQSASLHDDLAVARYNLTDGSLDTSFNGTGRRTDDIGNGLASAKSVAMQADGKIVVAGAASSDPDINNFAIARYNTDGSLDDSFAGDGTVFTGATEGGAPTDFEGKAVALQPDGKIVVAGLFGTFPFTKFAVARYNEDGSPDKSFGENGIVITTSNVVDESANAIAIQADGRIVIAGHDFLSNRNFFVARYNEDGSLDNTFGGDGKVTTELFTTDVANAVAIQADGRVVVAGYSRVGGNDDFAVVRYNTDGSLDDGTSADTTPGDVFGFQGKVFTPVGTSGLSDDVGKAMALQSDGKIVVAGYSNNGANDDFAMVRYNTDGSLDTSFDGDGKLTTQVGSGDDVGSAVAIQGDGKIVIAGGSFNGSNFDFAVVRYNANGSLDASYGTGGRVLADVSDGGDDTGYGIALDSLGRAVVAGEAGGLFGVVRILGDSQAGCNNSLTPASDHISARGGPCSFNVSAGAGCQWTAQTSDGWIVIVSDPTGTGNGAVSLEIRDNFTSSARLGTVTVGGETFTIVQEGRGNSCGYTLSQTFAAFQVGGGSGSFTITTSAGCGWGAVSSQNWIEITSAEVGIGNATINYTVSTNTTGAVRDGAILVGGQIFKVKQKGG